MKSKIRSKKTKKTSLVELQTAADFLSQGTQEEESGDRFTLSDLAKLLRFYQRAYEYYLQLKGAPDASPDVILDSIYNASRLLFHVYTEFVKDEIVNFQVDVKNIETVITSDYSVLQPLPQILEEHEKAISESSLLGHFSWDLHYNTCLVYTELIEDAEEGTPLEQYILRCIELFSGILEYQVGELRKLVGGQEGEQTEYAEGEDSDEEFSASEAIVPATILETITSCYAFVQAVYESINDGYVIGDAFTKLSEFVQGVEKIYTDLTAEFYVNKAPKDIEAEPDMLAPLEEQEVLRLELVKTSIAGLECSSLQSLIDLWENKLNQIGHRTVEEDANFIPEKYTIAADNFQNFLERRGSSLEPSTLWNLLNVITSYYKKSQDIVTFQLKDTQRLAKIDPNNSVKLSSYVSELVTIILSRVDVDVARINTPILNTGDDQFNKKDLSGGRIDEILQKNITTNLKNCLAYLLMNCGLREQIFDRLRRRQKRFHVLARQYVLGIDRGIKVSTEWEKEALRAEIEAVSSEYKIEI